MIESYKIIALVNELGDIDEVAEMLKLPPELVKKAIESIKGDVFDKKGKLKIKRSLEESESQSIKQAYNSFYRSHTLSREHLRHEITPLANQVKDITESFIGESNILRDSFVDEFAYGSLSPELVDVGYDFFANLSLGQKIRLAEWLDDPLLFKEQELKQGVDIPHQIAYFLQLAQQDVDNGINLYDHEKGFTESDFWQWFRETFYDE